MNREDYRRLYRRVNLSPLMRHALAETVDAWTAGGATTRIVQRTARALVARQLVEPAPEVGRLDHRPTPAGVRTRHEPPWTPARPKRRRWMI